MRIQRIWLSARATDPPQFEWNSRCFYPLFIFIEN